ncbi:2-succinylbenzoate--CoA ligase, chloroplastic/peroxisomal [Andrographis paniculata]|uniref:2-succinylbenzoate--CoA ligase, chloroplastic/peroxisomal n=1 Tax=Andrographis paniculata TaxID=175694 RepID=UPI0021E71DD1|nr:2-succinylbenzoate--CoA ligase, chloroplastic/peroxisomal [Andrographis paniculata]
MEIYSQAHVCQCLSRLANGRRDCVVTVYGDRRKTGMQFVEEVICLARGLLELGIKPGDVVSISALNSDLYLQWMLAITYVGGIAAPLNYRWSLEEAKSAMEVAQPVLLVTDSSPGFWHSTFSIDSVPSLRWHVVIDIPAEANNAGTILATELLKKPTGRAVDLDFHWAPEGAAVICFTSGTTGKPKGAAISHSAIIVQSLAKIAIVRYDEDDVYLHTAPLCHIGGISSAMAMLMAGGCHVILPKFEAKLACEAIREHLVTSIITVPTMMADLISFNRMNFTSENLDSVRKILNGGGGLSVELIKDAIKLFPRATLLSAYGMTEAASSLTFMTLYDPTKENPWQHEQDIKRSDISSQGGVCVGKPAPHIEIRVRSEESADTGRILMRGPHAMLHYWGQSPSSNLNPASEGWLDTGDIGQIDCHGNLWLNGRAKDRIKTGGENVYPEEVEGVISQHPGISRIVVVGVPNSRLSEMVVGCIQLKDGWKWTELSSKHSTQDKGHYLSSDIIRQFCKEQNLTGFKIPRSFILWKNDFPVTTTGKLRRDHIRAEVVSQMEFLPSKL